MKQLALDIGNVCVTIDRGAFIRSLGLPELPPELGGLCCEFETAGGSETAFLCRAERLFGGRFAQTEIQAAFASILRQPVPGMVDFVHSLRTLGVETHFFSDISPAHLRRTAELFPAFTSVSGGVFSFEAGAWKPEEPMFQLFERRYGRPDLYLDDRAELVAAAVKRGWPAEVFSAERLPEYLAKLS